MKKTMFLGAAVFAATIHAQPLSLGPLDYGVAVPENATGSGFLLFSPTPLNGRFTLFPNQAAHFSAIQKRGETWYQFENENAHPFEPSGSDLLIATLDFDLTQAQLIKTPSTLDGFSVGVQTTDLEIQPNTWNGQPNPKEFGLTGTTLTPFPSLPQWWGKGLQPVVRFQGLSQNLHLANLGQAKWIAFQAFEAIRASNTELADSIYQDLLQSQNGKDPFATPVTAEDLSANHSPLQIGQLKAIAKPFYDHLNQLDSDWVLGEFQAYGLTEIGVDYWSVAANPNYASGFYPWNPNTPAAENLKIANIAQLKRIFALRIENLNSPDRDSDGDGLPDEWEQANGLDPTNQDSDNNGILDGDDDFDQDGVSNRDEFLADTNPLIADGLQVTLTTESPMVQKLEGDQIFSTPLTVTVVNQFGTPLKNHEIVFSQITSPGSTALTTPVLTDSFSSSLPTTQLTLTTNSRGNASAILNLRNSNQTAFHILATHELAQTEQHFYVYKGAPLLAGFDYQASPAPSLIDLSGFGHPVVSFGTTGRGHWPDVTQEPFSLVTDPDSVAILASHQLPTITFQSDTSGGFLIPSHESDGDSLSIGVGKDISYCFWLRATIATSSAGGQSKILGQSSATQGFELLIDHSSGLFTLSLGDASYKTLTPLVSDVWNHICLAESGERISLLINGVTHRLQLQQPDQESGTPPREISLPENFTVAKNADFTIGSTTPQAGNFSLSNISIEFLLPTDAALQDRIASRNIPSGITSGDGDPYQDADGDQLNGWSEIIRGTSDQDYFNGQSPLLTLISGGFQTQNPITHTVPNPIFVRIETQEGQPLINAPISRPLPLTPNETKTYRSDNDGLISISEF